MGTDGLQSGHREDHRQSMSGIGMPSSFWINSRKMSSDSLLGNARTEPSHMRMLQTELFSNRKCLSIIFFGSNSMSSGFVQGVASAPSNARIVFDVPSVIWVNLQP